MTDSFSLLLKKVAPGLFVLLWSTGFIGVKYGIPYAPPFYFVAIRMAIAGLLLFLALSFLRKSQPITKAIILPSTLIGLTLHGAYLGGCFFAVSRGLPAGITALIVSLQPVLVSLFAARYLNEPLSVRSIVGLALGLTGLFVVVIPRINMSGTNSISVIALVACIVGLIGGTSGTILQKKYGGAIPTLAGTAIQYTATALVLITLALIFEQPEIQWTAKFVGALTWLVLALSFGAILLLFFLLSHGSAASVSSLYYLVPAATAIEAYFFFDEHVSPISILGTVITVFGVWLVVGKQKETPTA
ncbi:MAG: EamA family transporter [Actinobacteria bacterium]|nr:EamA family transporter [Actinomycetota bacterium]